MKIRDVGMGGHWALVRGLVPDLVLALALALVQDDSLTGEGESCCPFEGQL